MNSFKFVQHKDRSKSNPKTSLAWKFGNSVNSKTLCAVVDALTLESLYIAMCFKLERSTDAADEITSTTRYL